MGTNGAFRVPCDALLLYRRLHVQVLQFLLQRMAVGVAGGAQYDLLVLQALQLCLDKLQVCHLGLGFFGELFEVVLFVVDADLGHKKSRVEMKIPMVSIVTACLAAASATNAG